jgi:hypothetical protein
MTRPAVVVLAGHTGRLVARAGLACETQWEVDEHLIATVIAASRDLGRPVTGGEVHQLWAAAHETWALLHPIPPDRLTALLERIGKALADPTRQALIAAAETRRKVERGAAVLRQMAEGAPDFQRDRLPDWLTDDAEAVAVSW